MDELPWKWVLETAIPSSLDVGHRTIDELMTALGEAGWEGRDLFHVQMAVEEAMVNAIKHGNKEADDKHVTVVFRVSHESAWLQLTDQGEGFNPATLPDPTDDEYLEKPHGRGVMLIRELMTEVHYNERGNQVTMHKKRAPAEE